jgi:hypothetical protein
MTTEQRVLSDKWWPTQTTRRREEYVGPAICAQCHASDAIAQTTPIAKACVPAAQSQILVAHPRMTFRLGQYVYNIARDGSGSTFSVSDSSHVISLALGWAFGEGEVGETYVLERGGIFYESHVSYFSVLRALDLTPGHPHSIPQGLEAAIGHPLDAEETHLCFGCHNTASSTAGQFDPAHLIPGVTCEACHGPGAKHVAAMRAGRKPEGLAQVTNPAKLDPVDSVDFCGACHRTWSDVAEAGTVGVATVRFQPYRLESSRCWGKGDARITCLACHDPHLPLVRDQAFYDSRCLRCHLTAKGSTGSPDRPGTACRVGTKDCVTCHMPKYEAPDTHTLFTDHRIRIVTPDKHYPD